MAGLICGLDAVVSTKPRPCKTTAICTDTQGWSELASHGDMEMQTGRLFHVPLMHNFYRCPTIRDNCGVASVGAADAAEQDGDE